MRSSHRLLRQPNRQGQENPYALNSKATPSRRGSSRRSFRSRSSTSSNHSILSNLSCSDFMSYLQKKYVLRRRVEGNLAKKQAGQSTDLEQSSSLVQQINEELSIQLNRKDNEIQSLSIFRDELKLIQCMNRQYWKQASPAQLPIQSSKTLKVISPTESIFGKPSPQSLHSKAQEFTQHNDASSHSANAQKLSITTLRSKAMVEQKLIEMMRQIKSKLLVLSDEEAMIDRYMSYMEQRKRLREEEAADQIDLQVQAEVMKNNICHEIEFVLKDLEQTQDKAMRESKRVQKKIDNLRVEIQQKQEKLKKISQELCQQGIHRRSIASKQEYVDASIRVVDVTWNLKKGNFMREIDAGVAPLKRMPQSTTNTDKKLSEIEWAISSGPNPQIIGFKCFYESYSGSLFESGQFHSLQHPRKRKNVQSEEQISRITTELQQEQESRYKELCENSRAASSRQSLTEESPALALAQFKRTKTKGLKEINFYFEKGGPRVKGIECIYSVNPLLNRKGALASKNKISARVQVGDLACWNDLVCQRVECQEKSIVCFGTLWQSLNQQSSTDGEFKGFTLLYRTCKSQNIETQPRNFSRRSSSNLSKHSINSHSSRSTSKSKVKRILPARNPNRIESNQYCI